MWMLAPAQKTRSEAAGDDDAAHLGVLEAQPLDRVGELDVDAEVVGVELELVAGPEALVLGHLHVEAGDGAVDLELPVPVGVGMGLEADVGLGAAADDGAVVVLTVQGGYPRARAATRRGRTAAEAVRGRLDRGRPAAVQSSDRPAPWRAPCSPVRRTVPRRAARPPGRARA